MRISEQWLDTHLSLVIGQKSPGDVSYFDSDFTMEKAQLTPTDKDLLATMDQAVFNGFSYTNPDLVTKC